MKRFLGQTGMLVALIAAIGLGGCSTAAPQATSENKPPAAQQTVEEPKIQPVQVQNLDRTLTFQDIPKRAVSLNQHTTEIMLTLGLEKYMVGTAYMDDKILPELEKQYQSIPVLAKDYPSLEVLLGVQPDFVYGRQSAFAEKNLGSVQSLAEKGITAYVAQGTYVPFGTMKDVYDDITNIGKIFRVDDRAKQVVDTMKKQIAQVHEKLGTQEKPLRVFAYDNGEDKAYTAGQSLSSELIELAGGKNIFADVEKSWAEVSWEEVVKRDPEVILIYDYETPSAQEKIDRLLKNPALTNVSAIKNKRFVVLPLSDVFEGVRNATAVQVIAKGLYPEKF